MFLYWELTKCKTQPVLHSLWANSSFTFPYLKEVKEEEESGGGVEMGGQKGAKEENLQQQQRPCGL